MLPEPGSRIELLYPVSTDVASIDASPHRNRQLIVHRIRDLVADPLTAVEYFRRPFVARSRWLVLATEIGADRPKQFYLGSSPQFRSPGTLRLAVVDPETSRVIRLLGRDIQPTPADRRLLAKWLVLAMDRFPWHDARILAPDMRVCG